VHETHGTTQHQHDARCKMQARCRRADKKKDKSALRLFESALCAQTNRALSRHGATRAWLLSALINILINIAIYICSSHLSVRLLVSRVQFEPRFSVLIIKGARGSTLSVGKSHARNPTQNPTPNRPEPSRTIQRLRTAPCPQALRSARDAWRVHGHLSEETAHTPRITRRGCNKQNLKKENQSQVKFLLSTQKQNTSPFPFVSVCRYFRLVRVVRAAGRTGGRPRRFARFGHSFR
jgi:hypothetical protein